MSEPNDSAPPAAQLRTCARCLKPVEPDQLYLRITSRGREEPHHYACWYALANRAPEMTRRSRWKRERGFR